MLQSTRSCRTLHALFACHNNGSSSLPLLFDCEYCALAARSPLAIIVKAPAGCSPPALSACHNSNGSAASRCSLIVNLVLSLHPTNCCNDIDGWSMYFRSNCSSHALAAPAGCSPPALSACHDSNGSAAHHKRWHAHAGLGPRSVVVSRRTF